MTCLLCRTGAGSQVGGLLAGNLRLSGAGDGLLVLCPPHGVAHAVEGPYQIMMIYITVNHRAQAPTLRQVGVDHQRHLRTQGEIDCATDLVVTKARVMATSRMDERQHPCAATKMSGELFVRDKT